METSGDEWKKFFSEISKNFLEREGREKLRIATMKMKNSFMESPKEIFLKKKKLGNDVSIMMTMLMMTMLMMMMLMTMVKCCLEINLFQGKKDHESNMWEMKT